MKTHNVITIQCLCGTKFEFTQIQYDDFDCGMMGFLYCPDCKKIIMPSHHRKEELTETIKNIEGQDRGWSL